MSHVLARETLSFNLSGQKSLNTSRKFWLCGILKLGVCYFIQLLCSWKELGDDRGASDISEEEISLVSWFLIYIFIQKVKQTLSELRRICIINMRIWNMV